MKIKLLFMLLLLAIGAAAQQPDINENFISGTWKYYHQNTTTGAWYGPETNYAECRDAVGSTVHYLQRSYSFVQGTRYVLRFDRFSSVDVHIYLRTLNCKGLCLPGTIQSLYYSSNEGSSGTIQVDFTASGNFPLLVVEFRVNGPRPSDRLCARRIEINNVCGPLTPTVYGDVTLCTGGSTTLTVSPAGSSYQWSTGSQGQSSIFNYAGDQWVTVNHANGCSFTKYFTVSMASEQPDTPVPYLTQSYYTLCPYGSAYLSASPTAPTMYWSNGQMGSSTYVYSPGYYQVTNYYPDGCSATSPSTYVAPCDTGWPPVQYITAGDEVSDTFGVYPNVADQKVNVKRASTESQEQASVTIRKADGQVVLQESILGQVSEVNTSNLPDGLYYVSVQTSAGVKTSRVIIKHGSQK